MEERLQDDPISKVIQEQAKRKYEALRTDTETGSRENDVTRLPAEASLSLPSGRAT